MVIFLLNIMLIFFLYPADAAGGESGIRSEISFQLAWERLQYEEHESDTELETKAGLNNIVVGLEGIKRWKYLFLGARSTFPLSGDSSQEEVTFSDNVSQRNALEIDWIRLSGFAGYPLRYWFNPYLGLGWSEITQERKDFVLAGGSLPLHSVEEVKSLSFLLGLGGVGNFTPRWIWNYRAELYVPLTVKVTNTALPGFESSDKNGHRVELRGGIDYSFTKSIHWGLILYGGWMHWDGSQWKNIEPAQVKWPENDTYYSGLGLNVSYQF